MGRKWNNIKAKKASTDKQKSQVYSRLLHDITKAVKRSGAEVESNFMLRITLQKCRENNVPRDNIEKAIKKGLGNDTDGYEDIAYEGYGPGGVAIFIETSTNNVTRTIANIRSYFVKGGGTIGKEGCLQFIFERKSVFALPVDHLKGKMSEDDFTLTMIDSGAEDIQVEEGEITVTAAVESFGDLQKKFEELKIEPKEASLERIPVTFKAVNQEVFNEVMKMIEKIESDEDVQKVYHNIEYSDDLVLE